MTTQTAVAPVVNTVANTMVPTVKLPSAIQRQKERLVKLEDDMRQKRNESLTFQAPTPVTPEVKPVEAAPATLKNEVVEAPREPEKDSRYWEHRFKTAQGIYEADKLKMKAMIGVLESETIKLKEDLKSKPRETQIPNLEQYLSKDDIERYGPDVLNAVVKTARQAAEETSERRFAEELNRQLKPLQAKLESTETQLYKQREDMFWDTLSLRVPNWAVINSDPKFLEWLAIKDPISGIVRQDLLASGQSALDVERVVALFSGYMQSSPASKVNTVQTVTPEPVTQPVATSTFIPDAVYVTRQEIKDFYRNAALGRYSNKPEAKKLMEQKIAAAQAAGNIR